MLIEFVTVCFAQLRSLDNKFDFGLINSMQNLIIIIFFLFIVKLCSLIYQFMVRDNSIYSSRYYASIKKNFGRQKTDFLFMGNTIWTPVNRELNERWKNILNEFFNLCIYDFDVERKRDISSFQNKHSHYGSGRALPFTYLKNAHNYCLLKNDRRPYAFC